MPNYKTRDGHSGLPISNRTVFCIFCMKMYMTDFGGIPQLRSNCLRAEMREHILHEFCSVTAEYPQSLSFYLSYYTVITVPLFPFSASFTSPSEVISTFPCGCASR